MEGARQCLAGAGQASRQKNALTPVLSFDFAGGKVFGHGFPGFQLLVGQAALHLNAQLADDPHALSEEVRICGKRDG